MENTPLKEQAQDIMVAVEHDLQALDAQPLDVQAEADSRANALVKTIFNVISDVDMKAAAARAEALERQHPNLPREELAQKLIRDKCEKTGTVGAVSASAGIIPGIGTAAAITLGTAADIGVTFKMQAELVLELAALYDYPLNEEEKQRVVMVITGLSAGTTVLARKAGQNISLKVSEKFAERAAGRTILKAIPWVGIVASAGTNVLSTYIIGQRADTYFRLGPEAMGTWADTLRTVSGVDERKLGAWVADSSKTAGRAIATGAGKVGQAGVAAGGVVVSGAGKAGQQAGRGLTAYSRWLKKTWLAIFRAIGKVLLFVWAVISFVPRKLIGLFRRKKQPTARPANQPPAQPTNQPPHESTDL